MYGRSVDLFWFWRPPSLISIGYRPSSELWSTATGVRSMLRADRTVLATVTLLLPLACRHIAVVTGLFWQGEFCRQMSFLALHA
jgi:hypothetical protein